MKQSMTQVITRKPIRVSYPNLLQPRQDTGKYGMTILLPKTDTETKAAIDAAVEAARKAAPERGIKNPQTLKSPVHDGDGNRPSGEPYGAECKGMWVINASSKSKPGVVDRSRHYIDDETQIYPGMWANVDINFYAYDGNGNRGIACGLNNVQKVKDDAALGGRSRAEDVFGDIDDDEDDLI